jgi:hypothetical protein
MAGNYEMRKLLLACLLLSLLLPVVIGEAVLATDVTITASPNYTGVPLVNASNATAVTTTSATLHGEITHVGGSNVTCRGFEWGYATGNYTVSWNETGTFEEGTFSHNISGLTGNVYVYWRAFAINTQGTGNSTESSFLTTALPGPPLNFATTAVGDTIVDITWTMGARANTTIIRGSSSSYPLSVTDGYLVYSGNATSTTIDSLNLQTSIYYYRAWSHNDYGYSVAYAEGSAGVPIGILSIIFVVSLCGFALWQKDWIRTLLSVCIIIWGVFAMQYDIKIAAPLLALGTILFIKSVMRRIQTAREVEA